MPTTTLFAMTALCGEYLSAQGFEVRDAVISHSLAAEIEQLPGRAAITPMLSPVRNYFNDSNSFWLTLRFQGALVGTLGARFDDIGDSSLRDYLTRLHNTSFAGADGGSVVSALPASVDAINGGIVYMGDVYFHPDHRGDIGKTQCFCQYAFCLAFARWWGRAHWAIAMHRHQDVLRGKADQYGFTSGRYPAAQRWLKAPGGRASTEYLSLLSRADFLRNARLFVEDPAHLVSPPVTRAVRPTAAAE